MIADEFRTCRRTGCRWPASASLSYRYATREVSITDLGPFDPFHYDLCPHHADALTVPRNWELVDQRTAPASPREGTASERLAASRTRPTGAEEAAQPGPEPVAAGLVPAPRSDRYARLHAELAELAARAAPEPQGAPARPAEEASPWSGDAPVPRSGPDASPAAQVPGQLQLALEEGARVVPLVRRGAPGRGAPRRN